MRLEIDEEIFRKIKEKTLTYYEAIYMDKLVLVKGDSCISMLEDLLIAYESLEEEFEDYKRNIADNYRQIPISEQVGISDEDFI